MQITDLYQTKIEIVKSGTSTPYYNVNIDATDVQVIVTLTDFNGAAVSGKNVTLTVDHGAFTKVGSGSSTPTGSASGTSCSATTDSNGKISALYTASEWGLATFSANNSQSQVSISGWKTFYHDDYYTVTYNENNLVSFQVHISNSYSLTTSWKEFGYTWLTDAFRPVNPVKFFTGDNIICAISDNSSTLKFRSLSGNATSQLWGHVIYKRKG